MKKLLSLSVVAFVCAGVLLCGCKAGNQHTELTQIGQLANPRLHAEDRLIYLQEQEQWIPYEVLSADYDGHTLLLRQELLEQPCAFSADDSSYYADSAIDSYLNTVCMESFSPRMQQEIADTRIEICKPFPHEQETETIVRKLFLLSASEVDIDMEIVTKEGQPLEFFKNHDHYAVQVNSRQMGWWLRSAYTMDRGLAWHIQPDGTVGGNAVQLQSGVRPALCISSSVPIEKRRLTEHKEGYVLQLAE